ncbi:protein S-acyltransferase 21-like isoform X2 [Iris pallida]|uniref:S-acyltransferase n=1 Tax=Iris pallida TaxID=29817 RepID=A0AAX6FFP8_IRIPA|nr:protein S-acyltransferase 21-like isoform X2 [Iris pallida]
MARRHGWQLPAHNFQVVAVTVFFVLCIAFYAFFAPFLGRKQYEYVAVAVYSFFAISVFILYVRCTGIDPADPGILIGFDETFTYRSEREGVSSEEPNKIGLKNEAQTMRHKSAACSEIGCFFCALMVKEDCRKDEIIEQETSNNEALFCTLCNAEVRKFSKHCRSCDKCVDGFDHHCKWLNNCIGRKNYTTFLSLMGMSLAWLAVECGVGIAVFVRCFVDKRATESRITDRLGDVFSLIPFIIIVAFCTALSMLATWLLGELFFFHMILIRKGITTYDYVVAMRTQSEPPGPSVNEDPQSCPSSPMSAATTALSGSSLGLQYRGAWCTPPRIFVDQDEIVPHLQASRVPSTVDPDTSDTTEMGKRTSKRPFRISPWKLAKLDSNEAVRAAAKARASSSVLRPIGSRGAQQQHDADRRSSSITDTGAHGEARPGNPKSSSPFKSSYLPSRPSREDPETCPHTPSSFGSPHHAIRGLTSASEHKQYNPIYQTSASRSPMSTRDGEEAATVNSDSVNGPPPQNAIATVGNSRLSVYWDQEAGRFVSSRNLASSSSSRVSARREMLYTGKSIFFGGPLLGEGTGSSSRGFGASRQQQQRNRGRAERGGGSRQLPVFVPRDSHEHLHNPGGNERVEKW